MAAAGAFSQAFGVHHHNSHYNNTRPAQGPTTPPYMPQAAHKGKKRPADNALESEQRLSKRLDLLNLDHNGPRLYIPVSPTNTSSQTPTQTIPHPKSPPRKPPTDDLMHIEDTPHRIYIHDLSAELSDLSSDEDTPVFLPDIEKHISKIPNHVLRGPELRPTRENQLILYSVPSSLTIPEEQDRVRRAILEARARVRERQISPVGERVGRRSDGRDIGVGASGVVEEVEMAPELENADSDAMELDD